MGEVTFTQYLRPNGRRKLVMIEVTTQVYQKAQKIQAAGFNFECEVLGDPYSTVSFTITDHKLSEDVAIELCPNGPKVPEAVAKMIMGFKIP